MDDVPESSPDLDVTSSEAPSSPDEKIPPADEPLEAPIVASGNEPSSAAMDDVPESSPDLDITSSEEPPSPDENIPPDDDPLEAHEDASEYKYDDWILLALSTVDEDNDTLNGRNIDGIAKYITDRHEVPEDFREHMIKELEDLVAGGQVEKGGDRYKVTHGYFDSDEPAETSSAEAVSTPTQTTSSKEQTSTPTQTSSEGSPPPKDRRPSTSPPNQQNQKKGKIS